MSFDFYFSFPHFFAIQEFTGNADRNTIVSHDLNPPIRARYIRFRPTAWLDWIAMRAELYGCFGNVVVRILGILVPVYIQCVLHVHEIILLNNERFLLFQWEEGRTVCKNSTGEAFPGRSTVTLLHTPVFKQ